MKETKQLNSIICLRRDNDYNYEKVKYTFIPANGEIILVDTAKKGLLMKVGDGITCYAELNYTTFDTPFLIRGVYTDGNFYNEDGLIYPSLDKLYIDSASRTFYYYTGTEYEAIIGSGNIQLATPTVAGVMKLYNDKGTNTDGTMTQNAITQELKKKISFSLSSSDEEMIIFNQED